MKSKSNEEKNSYNFRIKFLLIISAITIIFTVNDSLKVKAKIDDDKLTVSTNFTDREISPNERIELFLNREIKADEGQLAVFVGESDLTSVFVFEPKTASFSPSFVNLPLGESNLTVYLVKGENWETLAEFKLKVKEEITQQNQSATTPTPTDSDKTSIEFTPNVSLNIKGQNQTLTFPREAAPERNPFTDVAGQGTFSLKVSRRGWTFSNQFDFAGSSFQQESLRFGELGEKAPQIDLSSYQMELSKGKFKANFGHVSFGSNRHLINSFSSRGVSVTVPVGKQNEVSFAAMNGTSIVGFDNFAGITRGNHSVLSASFVREFVAERPGGLRTEFTVFRGSVLPLNNFNQGEVNDAEKSFGFGFKVIGNSFKERLRYEVGVTRSKFTNPADALLEQEFTVTKIREVWRTAHYGEISFDFVKDAKLWKEKTFKLTGTFRHEEIQPLFRSIGASSQADRHQNQYEVSFNLGEMNFVYGNLRDRDNLNNLPSILKTLGRRQTAIFSLPLNSFFTPDKPKKWLPQISYTYDFIHQFGAFLPLQGEFRDLSQVPDQQTHNQSINAVWQLSDKFNFSYRYNRAFQDNRQSGREIADFRSLVNAVSVGTKPFGSLDFDFELASEEQQNLEQPRTDQTFRLGTRLTWRTPFLKNSTFNANLSTTLAGDKDNFTDSRNAEFDVQWAYRFTFGEKKFKKMEAQFFIRYANRYGNTIDRIFFVNNFNKTQGFNFGLNFNIF